MKRSAPLRRTKPIRKRNALRLKKQKAVRFAEQAALCRTLPCVGCYPGLYILPLRRDLGCANNCVPHHEPPVSCGGVDKDTVALCPDHHTLGPDARHNIGEHEFNRRFGINLRQLAAALHEQITRSNSDE
jgi:hypothetical protein